MGKMLFLFFQMGRCLKQQCSSEVMESERAWRRTVVVVFLVSAVFVFAVLVFVGLFVPKLEIEHATSKAGWDKKTQTRLTPRNPLPNPPITGVGLGGSLFKPNPLPSLSVIPLIYKLID